MQIRFDGPPSHVSGRFIEVEDDKGRSIKVGEWRQDGADWLLVIPDNDNRGQLRRAAVESLADVDKFLENDDGDSEVFVAYNLPKLADRLRFALYPPAVLQLCTKGEPCGECGRPLDCVCHPVHLKGVIFDESRTRTSGSIGEKLDQIIAEASAFSEYDVRTDDAFRLIRKLAQDIDNQLEGRLCPSHDANGECVALNEAISHAEDLSSRLTRALQVQNRIREGNRSYRRKLEEAGESTLRAWRRETSLQAQLSALHEEFRVASARLSYVASWMGNTYAKDTEDARYSRMYADAAKEVLAKGLDWLVKERGRGVMESTAASKSASEGSSPSARAREDSYHAMVLDAILLSELAVALQAQLGAAYYGAVGATIEQCFAQALGHPDRRLETRW